MHQEKARATKEDNVTKIYKALKLEESNRKVYEDCGICSGCEEAEDPIVMGEDNEGSDTFLHTPISTLTSKIEFICLRLDPFMITILN